MIAYRDSASAATDRSFSIDLPVPTGTQAGDYLIAHLTYKQGSASPVTGPNGWTQLRADDSIPDSGGVTSFIYTRVATSSEPASYTFTFHDFRQASGGIIAYSGVKTALPIDVTTVATSTATTTPTTPSISTVYAKPWLIWFLAARDNASGDTATPPAGMTQRWRANAPATGCVSLLADQVFSGPGSSGSKVGAVSPAAVTVAQALFLSPADENPDHPPTANAGPDRITQVGIATTLDGSGSSDVDPGDILTYSWSHVSGPNSTAQLSSTTAVQPSFTPIAGGSDVFQLTVTDTANNSATATVTVSITPSGVWCSTTSGQGLTASGTIPANAQVGDTAFFVMCSRPNGVAPTMPGWAAVTQAIQGGSSTDISMAIFRKRLAAGDIGATVSASVATLFDFAWTTQIITISGLHATAPQPGVINSNPIGSPQQFVNSVVGTPGTASYDYVVTSIDAAGETTPGTVTTISNAPNTLSNTNYTQITWNALHNVTGYRIYGRSSGSFKLVATITNANFTGIESDYRCGYNDIGGALGSQTPPTQIPTTIFMNGLGNDVAGDPVPERLYTTFANGKALLFTAAHLTTPNVASTVTDPSGVSPITTSRTTDGAIVLHSALKQMSAAGDVGEVLFTPSDFAGAWAAAGLTLRPASANGTPTARAGYDQVTQTGQRVYLDASDSFDEDGDTLTSHWSQTGGPTVRLSDATAMFPYFAMPLGTVTFQLTVTDQNGASSTDSVQIRPLVVGQLKAKNSSGGWQQLGGGVQ
ncbi:MAG TPA: PKD domain-containing protein [Candidatus Saccharimonas sp.]|nr:PKD domain-containing protein [Candidatus Saccharimonas sp.]